jgi:hypothetical protein
MASCVLHNYLMKSVQSYYSPPECFDRENTDDGTTATGFDTENCRMDNLDRRHPGKIANAAKNVREAFMRYFVNEGQVPWQSNFID